MGAETATVRNLEVVAVDTERNELWVRGGVPGGKGGVVKIRKAGE
jgi:large subunit ribosomal protein L3